MNSVGGNNCLISRLRRAARAFTLIELLVVVAIISILSAIATVNFIEAQNRAKLTRAKADLRTIAIGLESYCVACNDYPLNDGVFNVVSISLSTPVPYLSGTALVDPFKTVDYDPTYGILGRLYTYDKIVYRDEYLKDAIAGYPAPREAADFAPQNVGAHNKYGKWRLVSYAPDQQYSSQARFGAVDPVLWGSDITYDPTNGASSWGNILRTQLSSEGVIH